MNFVEEFKSKLSYVMPIYCVCLNGKWLEHEPGIRWIDRTGLAITRYLNDLIQNKN
jgi:hypothetical protein